jgi:hypothetical protein
MSHHDARVEPATTPVDAAPVAPRYEHVDDTPAARLLAHDLEHLVWDDEGDGVLPPPD